MMVLDEELRMTPKEGGAGFAVVLLGEEDKVEERTGS